MDPVALRLAITQLRPAQIRIRLRRKAGGEDAAAIRANRLVACAGKDAKQGVGRANAAHRAAPRIDRERLHRYSDAHCLSACDFDRVAGLDREGQAMDITQVHPIVAILAGCVDGSAKHGAAAPERDRDRRIRRGIAIHFFSAAAHREVRHNPV